MLTPEELAAQSAEADRVAKAAADAEALKTKDQTLEVDLFEGVKIALPKESAQKVIAARDAFKAEVKTSKESLAALQAQLSEATTKLKDFEVKVPEWQESQKRAGDLTVKITELEKIAKEKKASDELLTKILDTKMAIVPEGMKTLVKGSTTLEKLQNYEELFSAGVFKIPNIGYRKPGDGHISEITYAEFNALNQTQQANIQKEIQEGKIKLIPGSA
jgi:hypothetical protein